MGATGAAAMAGVPVDCATSGFFKDLGEAISSAGAKVGKKAKQAHSSLTAPKAPGLGALLKAKSPNLQPAITYYEKRAEVCKDDRTKKDEGERHHSEAQYGTPKRQLYLGKLHNEITTELLKQTNKRTKLEKKLEAIKKDLKATKARYNEVKEFETLATSEETKKKFEELATAYDAIQPEPPLSDGGAGTPIQSP